MKKEDFRNTVKLSKKIFIVVLALFFLVGGLFHKYSLFPFNYFSKLKNYIYENRFTENSMVTNTKLKSRKLNDYKFLKNYKLYSLFKDDVKINFENKIIKIKQKIEGNFFLIYHDLKIQKSNNILKDWKIEYNDLTLNPKNNVDLSNEYFQKYGVRGCLNLYNMKIDNLNINLENCNFENAIELVSLKGNINKIYINNAKNDGLDIDFGNIIIDYVIIQNVGNDCIDLFEGNIEFKKVALYNCKNALDIKDSINSFEDLKIFTQEKKNEFKKYKIF